MPCRGRVYRMEVFRTDCNPTYCNCVRSTLSFLTFTNGSNHSTRMLASRQGCRSFLPAVLLAGTVLLQLATCASAQGYDPCFGAVDCASCNQVPYCQWQTDGTCGQSSQSVLRRGASAALTLQRVEAARSTSGRASMAPTSAI